MVKKNVDLQGAGVLVTGAAGFIGSALCARLLSEYPGIRVTGIDNMNDYYDVAIKEERLSRLSSDPHFTFIRGDIADKELVTRAFAQCKPDVVVNLAAQAGVRYSITHPDSYIRSNLIGFYNILEACRHSYDGQDMPASGISSTRPARAFTEPTRRFRIRQTIRSIIRCRSTRQPRSRMS